MDDQQFRQLLDLFGLSWRGYRKVRKGVKKRIRRHMQELRCQNTKEYFLALDRDKELKSQCERLLTVSISRFFRDRNLWQALENQIFPGIVEKNKEGVKVWFAGCACGEEVYSFTIVWDRLKDRFECLPKLEILATDMNPVYLDKAQVGLFPRSSLKEVSDEVRDKYFKLQEEGQQYELLPVARKDILWKVHSLLHDPLGRDFHLIFLRNNLLTYYKDELKEPAFQKVIDCLVLGGFLIIGTHEKLPLEINKLMRFRGYPYIFQSRGLLDPASSQTV